MESYKNLMKAIEEYRVRNGLKKADLLRMVTSDPDSIKSKFYKALNGTSVPIADTLLEWLTDMGFTVSPPDEKLEGFSLVKKVNAVAGAGESWETSKKCIGQYAFRSDFLKAKHIHPEKCILMDVSGDSMEPTIGDGDMILVDESSTDMKGIKDGHIYLVSLGDVLMVKRLARIAGGWKLCSDNKERESPEVLGDELNNFKVYGKVLWTGRML